MKKPLLICLSAWVLLQSPISAGVMQSDVQSQLKAAEDALWKAQFADAAKLFKTLLKSADAQKDSLQAATIYDDYAWLLQTQGKNTEAAEYAQRALQIRQKQLPPNAPEIAESWEHIGEQNERQDALQPAADAYMNALKIRQQGGESQAIAFANLSERLAIVEMRLGNRGQASKLFSDSQAERSALAAPFQRYANPLSSQTVMYRYAAGSPYTGRDAVAGESLATINADGLLVQATVLPAEDFKGTTAFVRVINNGHGPVDFLPEPPVLLEMSPKFRLAERLTNDAVAAQIEKKGQHKANMIRFFQGDATTTVSQTVMTNTSNRNNWGYGMYPNGAWGAYPMPRNQSSFTTIQTQVPDWEARARAEAKAQAATQKANSAAALVRDQKLLATTLPPGEMTQGSVLFDSTKMKSGMLRIPIGNAVFEFPVGQ